ncbi:NAD(P)-dependent oxidoreductase [Vannielia litorea]|uniref:NAD(P)-dependent oxidoreductase n=1 Tax=Vannielia litorea TaxID=1217970 RepID=UPI001BCD10BD|nr:NAD(P)H-binding protein [Vannielia litorea]MBS8227241.1 NAD-dependent epimerase/dehydratase family protein [Vannielia litorea]
MKILLIGASGMIGSRILAEAAARGHAVHAASRNPNKIALPEGAEAVALDVTDGAAVAQAAEGVDVIVTTVSPRSTGDAVSEMAAIGAGAMEGAKAAGKPLLVVGGAGTLNLPDGSPLLPNLPPEILPEATGMKAFKESLPESGVDWTFFAPAALIEPGARTGKYRIGGDVLLSDVDGESRISAEDYAMALVDELEAPKHRGEVFTIAY